MTSKVGDRPDRFLTWRNPIMWGIAATLFILGLGWFLALLPACGESQLGSQTCETKFSSFLSATPNEVGDTLAGFASALAFVWIIVTVWLQSQELAAQRKDIREQSEATKKMAQAQTMQVSILEKQSATLIAEMRFQEEIRLDGYVKILIEELEGLIERIPERLGTWVFTGDFGESPTTSGAKTIRISDHRSGGEHPFLNYTDNALDIVMLATGDHPLIRGGVPQLRTAPPRTEYHRKIDSLLERIFHEEGKCSPNQRAKISQLALPQFRKWYRMILENDELWEAPGV